MALQREGKGEGQADSAGHEMTTPPPPPPLRFSSYSLLEVMRDLHHFCSASKDVHHMLAHLHAAMLCGASFRQQQQSLRYPCGSACSSAYNVIDLTPCRARPSWSLASPAHLLLRCIFTCIPSVVITAVVRSTRAWCSCLSSVARAGTRQPP